MMSTRAVRSRGIAGLSWKSHGQITSRDVTVVFTSFAVALRTWARKDEPVRLPGGGFAFVLDAATMKPMYFKRVCSPNDPESTKLVRYATLSGDEGEHIILEWVGAGTAVWDQYENSLGAQEFDGDAEKREKHIRRAIENRAINVRTTAEVEGSLDKAMTYGSSVVKFWFNSIPVAARSAMEQAFRDGKGLKVTGFVTDTELKVDGNSTLNVPQFNMIKDSPFEVVELAGALPGQLYDLIRRLQSLTVALDVPNQQQLTQQQTQDRQSATQQVSQGLRASHSELGEAEATPDVVCMGMVNAVKEVVVITAGTGRADEQVAPVGSIVKVDHLGPISPLEYVARPVVFRVVKAFQTVSAKRFTTLEDTLYVHGLPNPAEAKAPGSNYNNAWYLHAAVAQTLADNIQAMWRFLDTQRGSHRAEGQALAGGVFDLATLNPMECQVGPEEETSPLLYFAFWARRLPTVVPATRGVLLLFVQASRALDMLQCLVLRDDPREDEPALGLAPLPDAFAALIKPKMEPDAPTHQLFFTEDDKHADEAINNCSTRFFLAYIPSAKATGLSLGAPRMPPALQLSVFKAGVAGGLQKIITKAREEYTRQV